MIIDKKVYSRISSVSVAIRSLFGGGFRLLKTMALLEKSETFRTLDRTELSGAPQFPAVVDNDSFKCDLCADCVRACPTSALTVSKEQLNCDISACIRCGVCVEECSKGVLKLIGDYPIFGTKSVVINKMNE